MVRGMDTTTHTAGRRERAARAAYDHLVGMGAAVAWQREGAMRRPRGPQRLSVEAAIRALATRHGVELSFEDLFAFDSDAGAKLLALSLAGHVIPTRVATTGERQVWEFNLAGGLYLLVRCCGGAWEGFEPRDAESFDRLAAEMADPDLFTGEELGAS